MTQLRCMQRLRQPSKDGFTLVEVTLAVAIAAFAMMGLLAMTTMALRMGRVAVDDTFVSTIVQDVLTGLRTDDFATLTTAHVGEELFFDRDGMPPALSGNDPHYKCAIKVTKLSDFIAEVSLVIVWPNVSNFAAAPNTNAYLTRIANVAPYGTP